MKNIFVSFLLIFLFILSSKIYTQEYSHHDYDHNYEFGLAAMTIYLGGEKDLSKGMHGHLTRSLAHGKFGFGFGYELIFDKHKHQTIGLVALYRPINKLSIGVSPGIAMEQGFSGDKHPALHIETGYDFNFGEFHVGPLLEVAFDAEGYHVSLGLHIGFGL